MKELKSDEAQRPSENRIDEAVGLEAIGYFVVACPKDVTMYEDAIKTSGPRVKSSCASCRSSFSSRSTTPRPPPPSPGTGYARFRPRVREQGDRLLPAPPALTDEWMDLFGYWAPTVVTNTDEEYRSVREAAGLMDFTMLRKVDLDGPGALELVNSIVTRDVSKLTPGRIAYGARGRQREDGRRLHHDDAGHRPRPLLRGERPRLQDLQRRGGGSDIQVREFTDAMPHLPSGPLSREILQGLTSADLSNAAFPYYTFREDVEIAGIPVFMTRLGYTAGSGTSSGSTASARSTSGTRSSPRASRRA